MESKTLTEYIAESLSTVKEDNQNLSTLLRDAVKEEGHTGHTFLVLAYAPYNKTRTDGVTYTYFCLECSKQMQVFVPFQEKKGDDR